MNLAFGRIIDPEEREKIVGMLDVLTAKTLSRGVLASSIVINACDTLARSLGAEHIRLLSSLGVSEKQGGQYLEEAKTMLSREYLLTRLEKELGPGRMEESAFTANGGTLDVTEKLYPLGVLLHITAKNQYGLALYSVIEGLLTGNVNIVKLSGGDGLSGLALQELTRIEPRLTDYIYLFDYTSADARAISRLIDAANAVVVWGGDGAVRAVRQMTPPSARIIEWGHKISFAYVTEQGATKEKLAGLAQNIVRTNQLLCSSCQGVYLDAERMSDVYDFCGRFLPILDHCRKSQRTELPIAVRAQSAIRIYTASLESAEKPCKVFKGGHTSVVAYEDNLLDVSFTHGNCWVKRLPGPDIVSVLRPNKSRLQTAALLCGDGERNGIANQLLTAGVVRITDGANMSNLYCGAAHDGDYPLRKYTRTVSIEKMI